MFLPNFDGRGEEALDVAKLVFSYRLDPPDFAGWDHGPVLIVAHGGAISAVTSPPIFQPSKYHWALPTLSGVNSSEDSGVSGLKSGRAVSCDQWVFFNPERIPYCAWSRPSRWQVSASGRVGVSERA